MISKQMTEALTNQVNAELYSAYMYMAMSSYASYKGYRGAANWFFVQTQEEMSHARKIYDYINSVGEHAVMKTIEAPPAEYDSLQAMFEATLEHEKKVTALINDLANLAESEKDHATAIFLQWFISEQVEEEESVNEILGQLELAGTSGGGLFMIDKELAARAFTPPAAE